MYKKTVKGHVITWTIESDQEGLFVVNGIRRYSSPMRAHRAIRTAEHEYLKKNPNAPVANTDIWFDHDILIVDNNDGGYYE